MNKIDDKGLSGELSLHSNRFEENQSQETSSQTIPVVGEAAQHDTGGGSTDHEEHYSPGIEILKTILNFHALCICISNREHCFFKRKHA